MNGCFKPEKFARVIFLEKTCMSTKVTGFCFDVTGRTHFFSKPLSNALQFRIFSCSLTGNKSFGVRLIRLACYVRNIISLVFVPSREDWIIYNIPKFLMLEAIAIRYFTRGHCVLLLHNKNLHHDRIAAWATSFFLSSFDKFVCHSPDVKKAVLELLPHADVLLTPIPVADFLSPGTNRNRTRIAKVGPVTVGFIGQFRCQKGADLFYEAALKFLDCYPGLMRFVMAGEPIDFFPGKVDFNESEIVVINKFLEDQELNEVLQDLDVIIVPYRSSSGSAISALAAFHELPMIASNLEVFRYMETHYPFITVAEMKTVDEVIEALLLSARRAAEDATMINWSQIRESMSMTKYAGQIAEHFRPRESGE